MNKKFEIVHHGFSQHCILNGRKTTLRAYRGNNEPSSLHNAAVIRLDLSLSSCLKWDAEKGLAKKYIEKGLPILWEFDFGDLKSPLEESHFLSLNLAIEHFNATVWETFKENSLGVILFEAEIKKTLELIDDLLMLGSQLPSEEAIFLLLDATDIEEAQEFFKLTDKSLYGHFNLFIKSPFAEKFPYSIPMLGWDHGSSSLGFVSEGEHSTLDELRIPLAVHFHERIDSIELKEVLNAIGNNFRILPYSLFTQEWEGVDDLIVFSKGLPFSSKRDILGFSAANGRVLTVGEPLGFCEEFRISELSN